MTKRGSLRDCGGELAKTTNSMETPGETAKPRARLVKSRMGGEVAC